MAEKRPAPESSEEPAAKKNKHEPRYQCLVLKNIMARRLTPPDPVERLVYHIADQRCTPGSSAPFVLASIKMDTEQLSLYQKKLSWDLTPECKVDHFTELRTRFMAYMNHFDTPPELAEFVFAYLCSNNEFFTPGKTFQEIKSRWYSASLQDVKECRESLLQTIGDIYLGPE